MNAVAASGAGTKNIPSSEAFVLSALTTSAAACIITSCMHFAVADAPLPLERRVQPVDANQT